MKNERSGVRTATKVLGSVAFLFFPLAAGCAPANAHTANELEYERMDRKALFEDFQTQCKATGGRIVIRASTLRRDGVPRRGDDVTCV